jgi:hypothetical protein
MNRDLPSPWERAMSRRELLGAAAAGGALLLLPACGGTAPVSRPSPTPSGGDTIVVRWNRVLLQGVRDSKIGPPMVARALAVAHTCMYDAWSAYDAKAVGTRLGATLRRPASERTLANKQEAVSFAAYRAAVDLFPGSTSTVFDPLMRSLGHRPGDLSTDTSTPSGIGNVAAGAVLTLRHRDGANQLGDEPGGPPGVAYADYTGYTAVNRPMDIGAPFDAAAVSDPNAWQPLRYLDTTGAPVTPSFVGAQWQRVTPFALHSSAALRSATGPARYQSADYLRQAQAVLDLSAGLTDEQKMIAEYWADGPHSELPPGHWNLFAQFVSQRDHHSVDMDVRLFFALTNALLDASIVAWDNKRAYNSVRPITAIRYLFRGTSVRAWGGPRRGPRSIAGAAWFPYQPTTFPTPPFPEYSSGHSCFSAAAAEVLRLFTGSDRFGDSVSFQAGVSRVEPAVVPATEVTLRWPTFSAAADQAGMSRRLGGIHFEQGDLDARAAGRLCGRSALTRAIEYWKTG